MALVQVEGRTFGRLTTLRRATPDEAQSPSWRLPVLCRCSCGKTKFIEWSSLQQGLTKSCGCLRIEKATKHGHKTTTFKSRLYNVWELMIRRCCYPSSSDYRNYGGRGITVCSRWRTFKNFLEDMGEPPPGLTLDRKDNNGPYSPDNCRWATRTEQNNNSRNCRWITMNGETKNLTQWANTLDIPVSRIYSRLSRGWSVERTLSV